MPTFLVLLTGLGCNSGGSTPKFRTQAVKQMTIDSKVVANGTVNPVITVLVGSQVSGMIKELHADYNSVVKRGQIVARIDPRLFQAKVAEARAQHQQSQADVARVRANLADAELDFQRNTTLRRQDLVSQNDLDKARTKFESTRAELQAAQARVATAAAALKEAEINLEYTEIISPVDGVVVSRNVDVGQTVAASFQTPTLFTIARDLTQMQVETAVDEGEVGKLKVGQKGTFTVDAYPGTVFTGEVTTVRLAPQTVQNVVTYTVVVETHNPEFLLKPGMTATMSLHVARQEGALAVPNAALRFQPSRPPEAPRLPAGPTVWRLNNQATPEPVPVTLGLSDGAWTEIKEGDLKAGDPVIISQEMAPGSRPQTMFRMF